MFNETNSSMLERNENERSSVYLDFSDENFRKRMNGDRSRRYSVSFDDRPPVLNMSFGDGLPSNQVLKSNDTESFVFRTSSQPTWDSPLTKNKLENFLGSECNYNNANLMSSSLIENKLDDKNSPVSREIAVQLLKEYVKSLKDFSSLLKLRQSRETKDSATSPVHSPSLEQEEKNKGTYLKLKNSDNQNIKCMLRNQPSRGYMNCKQLPVVSQFTRTLPANHVTNRSSKSTINFNRAKSENLQPYSTQSIFSTLGKMRLPARNETVSKEQQNLPKKIILRKFFQHATEAPPTSNISSVYSGTNTTDCTSYAPMHANKLEPGSELSTSTTTYTTDRSHAPISVTNQIMGNKRSEAAFHRQYTQMLWPADVPVDFVERNNNANMHKTSLELKTSSVSPHKPVDLAEDHTPNNETQNFTRLTSPLSSTMDSFDASKFKANAFEIGTFQRGGSVSPSIRLGPLPQFGKQFFSPSSTNRVLVSPHTDSSNSNKSFKAFTSTLDSHTSLGPTAGSSSGTNPLIHRHKVTAPKPSRTLNVEKDTKPSEKFVREFLSPSSTPSMVSRTRSSSFDSFNNAQIPQLSSTSYNDTVSREEPKGVLQTSFRRNVNEFPAGNKLNIDEKSGPSNKASSERVKNTLGSPTAVFSTSASSVAQKSVSPYTRPITTPPLTNNQKLSLQGQTWWTTISRKAELKQPLDLQIDDGIDWASDDNSPTVEKLDIATQTDDSMSWSTLSEDEQNISRQLSNESLQSDLSSIGPVLQTWPLSLQSVVKSIDVDAEVEQNTMNGWNPNTEEDNLSERSQSSGSPTPVPSPTPMSPLNKSAFSRPLVRRHSMRGALSERSNTVTLGEQSYKPSRRLSLSRPFRSSLGSPTCASTNTDPPRCRSVHFSTDVLVAHTGQGPEPLMLSSAPLKEPAPYDGDNESPKSKSSTKPFFFSSRRFVSTGSQPPETNFREIQVSINQGQPQPRLPRPTPFRRNLVPRGVSEPNL